MPEPTQDTQSAEPPAGGWFATTHWSVVMAAGDSQSAEQTEALERLCRSYWRPLYAFVLRQGREPEEAQDLTQAFFARLLERRDLQRVRQEKGRFRSYLLVSLKHFLANEWHRAQAARRGGGQTFIPLDELLLEDHLPVELADPATAEKVFDRRWALTLLERVLDRLAKEFAGNRRVFEWWKKTLSEEDASSLAEMAAELGMTGNALKQACHRLRERYRQLLREEVAHTVATPMDIEEELRHLIAALRD